LLEKFESINTMMIDLKKHMDNYFKEENDVIEESVKKIKTN
jgi:hypothetical protein